MVQPLWRIGWMFLKKLKIELPYGPSISTLGRYPEKTILQKNTCTTKFKAALFTIAKTWNSTKYPLMDERIKKVWYIYLKKYYSAIRK